ncbi:MAG TPA: DUF362 domain-containing protein [Vicinamibacterales bacterium]|nr:DUF362 domain-containing protein [Vicinamibacterales bacterium]
MRLSRRAFLSALPVAAVAASCRRTPAPFLPGDFAMPARSSVGLFAAADYHADFADVIGRGLTELGVDVRGLAVLLKPNMVEYEPGEFINTNPAVVAGAAVALRRAGARSVVVAEGPGHRRDVEYLLTATGLHDLLRDDRITFVDLNHDDVREVPLRSWFTGMRTLALPASVLSADLVVSMPKLKAHHWAGITCGMKNLFGTVPGAVYGWPKNILHVYGIDASILDLASTIRPGLTIVDAVVGMDGDGPIMGNPHPLGFVAMGTDVVAVDATCARVVGIDPLKMRYLETAGRYLGNTSSGRIQHVGEPVARFRSDFELIPRMAHIRA